MILVDSQIINAFMELLRLLKVGRFRLEPETAEQGLPYSREAAELTRKLQALEEEPGYPAKEMVQVIYERARSQYRVARIRDRDYQTDNAQSGE